MKTIFRCICLSFFTVLLISCEQNTVDLKQFIPPAGKYDVKILRDSYGVPHIYGKTDADVAYGLAYAHCEDDFDTIQEGVFLARGLLASINGLEAAPFDYLVKLFRFREIVEEKYETDLAPETRKICEAYAEGYNHYAVLHPEKVIPGVLPTDGKDVVMGFVAKSPLFFGMDHHLKELLSKKPKHSVSQKAVAMGRQFHSEDLPIGSNTFAIAPRRTPDGKTHLAINSHQPWTGPVAWYEARLKSNEGLDIIGGVFPGTPVVLHGHNRDLGWAHTVNMPDLVDVYALEMNPENLNQYKFDGHWRDLERDNMIIWIRLWKGFSIPLRREVAYSVHGPVIRSPHGVYAIRYAGYGDIRQVEQWYRMGKSTTVDEFEQAMRIQAIPSFNVGYADKTGNIWYIYNAKFPVRAEGYDWEEYLPGNTSETLWTEYLPFEKVPQVRNPESGFVQNCNSSPFRTTIGPNNPKPEDFSKTLGIEPMDHMTNRSLRLLELLGADDSITEEEFYTYKYDIAYSKDFLVSDYGKKLLEMPAGNDQVIAEAQEVLKKWDYTTTLENTSAAIVILSMEPIVRAKMFGHKEPDLFETFKEKAHLLKNLYGKVDVPWGQVNRLVRGTVNVGLCGGPDTLHAVYGNWKKDHLEGMAGDCYVLMATWDQAGKVHSRSIHQFGSATLDETSPHYADQVPMFIACETKPVWLDESDLRQHLESEYRPGEPRSLPSSN
ncbi:MAG TPA: acylase [Candidatus Hydrogenedentes bacterium]|nr:acylase [Candidatus Hydrogenedentota bacterium]